MPGLSSEVPPTRLDGEEQVLNLKNLRLICCLSDPTFQQIGGIPSEKAKRSDPFTGFVATRD